MPKFRKKPIEVEAEQWDGTYERAAEIAAWVGRDALVGRAAVKDQEGVYTTRFSIRTLEGTMSVSEGDWVIRGIAGEHYPCEKDIFAKTYDPVD